MTFHMPTLSSQFVFIFTALTHNLYYQFVALICIFLIIGSSSSGNSNSSSSNFFRIDNTNVSMPILVN